MSNVTFERVYLEILVSCSEYQGWAVGKEIRDPIKDYQGTIPTIRQGAYRTRESEGYH